MEPKRKSGSLAKHDLPQFYLLIMLYLAQGIPVGLAFGTVPFLLKSLAKETSFTSLGIFSMATYPYSLKIIWSPIVDSLYNKRIGRRRSWIIPVQFVSGFVLWALGWCISQGIIFDGVDDAFHNRGNGTLHSVSIKNLTWWFGLLVFLCATQDIAVDGWALTILSKESLSYASTAQTIGLNIGYFMSFTIFLSLNSSDFANKYFRNIPLDHGFISLGEYMKFSGMLYIVITIYIIFCTKEKPYVEYLPKVEPINTSDGGSKPISIEYDDGDVVSTQNTSSIKYIYRCFIKVLKLKSVRSLAFIHMISKFAFQCNEAATNLKLLEQGFKREDLAVTVLIDLPFEIIFGYYVVKWSSDKDPMIRDNRRLRNSTGTNKVIKFLVGDAGVLTPWLWGFLGRLAAAVLGSYVVKQFPKDGEISTGYFCLVIFQHLLGSFMNTVQFIGISAFHTRVVDPVLGGTYMTLLNTLSNFGGTWPRLIIMSMINYFTVYQCTIPGTNKVYVTHGGSMQACTELLNGTVTILRDGYYITNLICIVVGLFLYFGYLKRKILHLQSLPISSWRFTSRAIYYKSQNWRREC
ncbi:AIC_G0004000.mRNA.1.CDS.1 [Saccharomyces cerevisiae]|nr:AIC_G0004000.mRNA.1.CDS.1 [Saccharomyces cerevisiae]CAI4276328.1 CAS_1a_G0004050.mRNA.1.CDS.1 [Saccharomyces cerevisiae]CAI6503239.1 AIC_G0004000.mRNA.1.CDS.1 [Saccharomyces cerevisiae]CAI7155569.1 CAS_1a_G0004050.mRNA.1.CDS.1 [Saccharomyces cerevisiae]